MNLPEWFLQTGFLMMYGKGVGTNENEDFYGLFIYYYLT